MAQRLTDDARIERFVSCFEVLADRLGTGRFVPEQLASCTAGEMALHMVIEVTEAFVADGIVPTENTLGEAGKGCAVDPRREGPAPAATSRP